MTSKDRAISVGLQVLASDPAVRDIRFRGVLLRNIVHTHMDLDMLEAEGRVRGLRRAIVIVLTARGLAVDDAFRAALDSVNNLEDLEILLRRAATAASTAEILGPRD